MYDKSPFCGEDNLFNFLFCKLMDYNLWGNLEGLHLLSGLLLPEPTNKYYFLPNTRITLASFAFPLKFKSIQ